MKLSNVVLALTLAALPAVASANKHENTKHGNAKNIFVANEDEGLFKNFSKAMTTLDDHSLVGASNKSSAYSRVENVKPFHMDSFQSKFESENKYSNNFSWFGGNGLLANANYNYFFQAANGHTPLIIIVVLGESFKNFGWNNIHDRDNHQGWNNHKGWNNHDWDNNNHCHAPVPEPTTYALMLVGLLGLGFAKRRKS